MHSPYSYLSFVGHPIVSHLDIKVNIFHIDIKKNKKQTYGAKCHDLIGYMDADGTMQEHRHAISGHVFLIDGGAISWSSQKQELVTLSTAKAEYIATTHVAKEALWLHTLIHELFPFTCRPNAFILQQPSSHKTHQG